MAKRVGADAVRRATESFEQTCSEWLHVIAISVTSGARAAIATVTINLEDFIRAAVRDIPAGRLRPFEEFLDYPWEQLRDAANAITLDEANWNDDLRSESACTLLKAAEIGRSRAVKFHAEFAARRGTEENAATPN